MGKEKRIRIGVVQFNSKTDEPGENLEKAVNYIENLVEEEVDLVLLRRCSTAVTGLTRGSLRVPSRCRRRP